MILKNINKIALNKSLALLSTGMLSLGLLSISCNEDEIETESSKEYGTFTSSLFTATVNGLDVEFNNYSIGASSFLWEVYDADGELLASTTSEDSAFDYTFSDYGTYEVLLTTYDAEGNILNETDEDDDTSGNQGLDISVYSLGFTYEVNTDTVSFSNESIAASTYEWDFGDDSEVSTDESPSYTYTAAGDYTVTMTAYDADGVKLGEYSTLVEGVTLDTGEGVESTFDAVFLNGTFDEYTTSTGDNADGWDMTPNSTLVDNTGATVDSPYTWSNPDLDAWLTANCGDDSEQPSSTSDGNKFAALGDRGLKLNESCRRLYQPFTVEVGVEYTISIDTRSEVEGLNPEIYILNNAVVDESDLEGNSDTYLTITDDFNSSKATTELDTFTTTTFSFIATSTEAIFYMRCPNCIDGSNEVFVDNAEIETAAITGGTDTTVAATFEVVVQNGTFDDYTTSTGDNADGWDMTPNSTLVDNTGATVDSPYTWSNSDLDAWLTTNCGDDSEQPSSTSDGNKFALLGDRGLKLNEACRRLYQPVTVEVGVEYTLSIQTRSEVEGLNPEVYILNTAIADESDIEGNSDAFITITDDFNSSKATTELDTFTTTTLDFTPTTTTAIIYVRCPNCIDGSNEVFVDNIDVETPGF